MFPNVKEQQQAGGIFQYKLLLPPKAVRQLRALAEVAAEEAARVAADEAVAATEAEAARVAAVAQMEVRRLARLEKRRRDLANSVPMTLRNRSARKGVTRMIEQDDWVR